MGRNGTTTPSRRSADWSWSWTAVRSIRSSSSTATFVLAHAEIGASSWLTRSGARCDIARARRRTPRPDRPADRRFGQVGFEVHRTVHRLVDSDGYGSAAEVRRTGNCSMLQSLTAPAVLATSAVPLRSTNRSTSIAPSGTRASSVSRPSRHRARPTRRPRRRRRAPAAPRRRRRSGARGRRAPRRSSIRQGAMVKVRRGSRRRRR